MKLLAFTNGENTFLVPEDNESMIINLTLLNYERVVQLDSESKKKIEGILRIKNSKENI
jgi:hypothetical protein